MKRSWFSLVRLAGIVAISITGCASTQDHQTAADRDLCAALDTNKDGRISQEEFMARATDKKKALEVFEKCDVGHKGYLTYDEVISQRLMIPPAISITPWPVVRRSGRNSISREGRLWQDRMIVPE
jgi:Ca2+-binding EF-hand superfamily protein